MIATRANSAAALLAELTRRGIELQVHGDKLRYRPASALTLDERDQLVRHKPELLRLLDPAHELDLDERAALGYVNFGWQPDAWAARLRQLAHRCEALHPELATTYQLWAENVEKRTRHLHSA